MNNQIQQNNQNKNNTAFIIIVIVLVIAIAGVSTYGIVKNTSNPITIKPSKVEKEGTTKVDFKGYTFSFPSTIKAKEINDGLQLRNKSEKYLAVIYFHTESYNTFLQNPTYFEKNAESSTGGKLISSKEETIAGRKWLVGLTQDPEGYYLTFGVTTLPFAEGKTILTMRQAQTQDYNSIYKTFTNSIDSAKKLNSNVDIKDFDYSNKIQFEDEE